jgi:hypothetical protein
MDGWEIPSARESSVTGLGPSESSRASSATIDGEIDDDGRFARREWASRSRKCDSRTAVAWSAGT